MSSAPSETSTKPYLIRAIHEWCSDNGYTPYLAVAVDGRCTVPRDYVKAGEIVLNVSSSATNSLLLGNDMIEFQARFGGVAREISVPVECVSAVYARENGHGMAFDVPRSLALTPEEETLKAIAQNSADAGLKAVPALAAPISQKPNLKSVSDSADAPESPPIPPTHPNGGPPKLTRIK